MLKHIVNGPRPIDSVGPHHMWGFSPALDLLDLSLFNFDDDEVESEDSPLNILLVQPGDIRSMLKTISQRRRHTSSRPLHFYIWDQPIEVLARHLLLLEVVHEWEVPIRQRTCLFLEIFGNSLVQERTSRHLEALGRGLVDLVCSQRGRMADLIDFSFLKYRERDLLETTFKAYAHSHPYNLEHLRDTRVRHLLGSRYDSRKHISDWDYFEGIKPHAGVVHIKQYREWRMSGIAFEFGDQQYTCPNRTMQSFTEGTMKTGRDRGLKKEVRGYWLDIIVGPYISIGIDCDKPNEAARLLFKVMNKGHGAEQHRHNTGEVAVYNIVSYLWEIETGTQYLMRKDHDIYSGIGEDDEENMEFLRKMQSTNISLPTVEEDGDKDESDEIKYQEAKEEISANYNGEADNGQEERKDSDPDALPPPPLTEVHGKEDMDKSDTVSQDPMLPSTVPPQPPSSDNPGTKNTSTEESTSSQAAPHHQQESVKMRRRKRQAAARATNIVETFEGVKVFLLGSDFTTLFRKSAFKHRFHRAFFSCWAAQHIGNENINEIFAPGAAISVECAKFIVPLRKDEKQAFASKVCSMAEERSWNLQFENLPKDDAGQPLHEEYTLLHFIGPSDPPS